MLDLPFVHFCARIFKASFNKSPAIMKVGKPKSKRVPVRLRHKIEKASAAKQRKQRKEAKKNPQWRSRVKKDPGIPNLFPYKAKVLAEIEESKRKKEEEQLRRREVAKAQREGRAIGEVDGTVAAGAAGELVDEEGDEVLLDEDDVEYADGDEDMEVDGANPMAALLASARARADAYIQDEDDDEDDDEEDEADEWTGITETTKPKSKSADATEPKTKTLPKQVLEDPVKTCTRLLTQMQQAQDGIQRMIDHYQTPPLVTAGSDLPTRFLVEVARKRGRLGRGGVPNLHSAALTVLGDVNEGRLVLPAVAVEEQKGGKGKVVEDSKGKGHVTVVQKMAEPFRIEGLWGDDEGGVRIEENEMVVEA